MALQRGSSNLRIAFEPTDADIMDLLQQQQPRDVASMLPAGWSGFNESQKLQWFNENQVTPQELLNAGVDQQTINTMSQRGYTGGAATAPVPAPAPAAAPAAAPFNPVGFDWSKGVQNIGGTIYHPQFESVQLGHGEEGGRYGQGALQNVLRYKEGQTAPGQTYEILDPLTGQITGTGKFKEQSRGFFGDLFGMVQQAAQDLGPLALSAIGINPGIAAGLGGAAASALGIPVASTAGAAGLTAGQVAALGSGLASTGIGLAQGQNPLEAIKAGLLSGATAMVPQLAGNLVPSTGNAAVDTALKSAVASGTRAALSGQNVEEAIAGALVSSGLGTATGLDPKVIGNAVRVITSGGDPQAIFNTVVSAAQGGLIPGVTPGKAPAALPTQGKTQFSVSQLDTPQKQAAFDQLLEAFQQEQGRPPSQGEQVAFFVPAALGVPAALEALAAVLPLAGGALWLAAQQNKQQPPPPGMSQQEWLGSQTPTRETTSVSPATLAAQGAAELTPSDETARLAARYPAPTTAPPAAPRAPNVDPILQLIQQTSGTPYDVSGDPYAQLPGLVPPDTVAQDVPGVTSPPVDTSVGGKPTGVVDTTVPGTAPSGVDLTVPGRAADQTGLPTTIPFSGAPAGAGTGGGGGEATGGGGEVAGEAATSDDAAVEAEVINLLNRLRGTSTAPAAAAGSPEPEATGTELPLGAAATSDAQRLANLLNIDVNTANALIASNPELYGELIGTPTTGTTAPDLEKMSSVDIRNLLALLQQATGGDQGVGNVLTPGETPPPVTSLDVAATSPATTASTTGGVSVTGQTATQPAVTTTGLQLDPVVSLLMDQITVTQPSTGVTTGPTITSGVDVTTGPAVTTGTGVTTAPSVTTGLDVTTGPTVTTGPVVTTGLTVTDGPAVTTGLDVTTGPTQTTGPVVTPTSILDLLTTAAPVTTAIPVPTQTVTVTQPVVTPSTIFDPVITVTPLITISVTPFITQSVTESVTPLITPTITPTVTLTETPTVTTSKIVDPVISLIYDIFTPTPSLTVTVTVTETNTVTQTVTETPLITTTITPSITPSQIFDPVISLIYDIYTTLPPVVTTTVAPPPPSTFIPPTTTNVVTTLPPTTTSLPPPPTTTVLPPPTTTVTQQPPTTTFLPPPTTTFLPPTTTFLPPTTTGQPPTTTTVVTTTPGPTTTLETTTTVTTTVTTGITTTVTTRVDETTTTGEPPPPPTTAGSSYLFDPGTKDKVLTEALTAFSPPIFKGRVGTAYYRPAGEIESEATGKKRRDVWNEASLRLKDALGL